MKTLFIDFPTVAVLAITYMAGFLSAKVWRKVKDLDEQDNDHAI